MACSHHPSLVGSALPARRKAIPVSVFGYNRTLAEYTSFLRTKRGLDSG